jgi:hypothetical protein
MGRALKNVEALSEAQTTALIVQDPDFDNAQGEASS